MLFSRFLLGSLACLSLCVLVGCGGGSTTAEKTASEKPSAMGSSAPVAATASVVPTPTSVASPATATNKLESQPASTKMDKMAAADASAMAKPASATKSASAQSASASPESEPVYFAAGSSSATLKGVVIRGDRKIYQLNAGKNQTMTVNLGSLENNGVFDLIAPDGTTLTQETTSAKQVLPATGDYQVVVGGTRGNVSYDLTVSIK
jgi:hypothetical protein